METLIETFGDAKVLLGIGLLTGLLFGAAGQHSRFCLRAATAEVADGGIGPKLAIWLIAFSAAVFGVQGAIALGWLDVTDARQLSATGSMSGAVIGGLLFGAGMILARGCASRLLILSATGNLRAIVTGLVLTLVAQASLRGILSPAREYLGAISLVDGGAARNLLNLVGIGHGTAAIIAALVLAAGFALALRRDVELARAIAAAVVGVAVATGWLLTYMLSQSSFEVVAVSSVTFTGPSTDTLMGLVNERSLPASFGVGLVPGVFLGAALMAFATGEFRIQRFGPDTPMEQYLVGASLMGFGSMLAGGCAVGAGVSGGAIFAVTAWVAVFFMWIGAMATHVLTTRVLVPAQA